MKNILVLIICTVFLTGCNIGKLVTSENCDILVAVNKKNSELFIFSKNEIDDLPINSINRKDYMNNWENWSKINE